MITNGYLRFVVTDGGGIDGNGEPIAAVCTLSDPLPCLIKTISDNRMGRYDGGTFRMASFAVLVEAESGITGNRIRLERCGEQLGEYPIMKIEPLLSVGRIRITV